jgi:hypothetical protein
MQPYTLQWSCFRTAAFMQPGVTTLHLALLSSVAARLKLIGTARLPEKRCVT